MFYVPLFACLSLCVFYDKAAGTIAPLGQYI